LLKILDIKGSVVTIDAMGCQKKIAAQIIEGGADYLFTLKANHKNLHKEVKGLFESMDKSPDMCLDSHTTENNGHGRYEKRAVDVISVNTTPSKDNWRNLQTFVRVRYTRTINGKETVATRYFLTSLPPNARRIGSLIRNHWSIENNLHWVLDVIFDEDASKAKKDNSPLNKNVLRKTALSLLLPHKLGRVSLKKMMFRAALEKEYLEMVLFGG
jgi:predicted transposase YbfD/YdcC